MSALDILRSAFERARTERDRCTDTEREIGERLRSIDLVEAARAARQAAEAFESVAGRNALGEATEDELSSATTATEAADRTVRQQRAATAALTTRLEQARLATQAAQRAVKAAGAALAEHLYRAEDRRRLALADKLFASQSRALRLRHYAEHATSGAAAVFVERSDETGGIRAIARAHGLDHSTWRFRGGEIPADRLTEVDVLALEPPEVADAEPPELGAAPAEVAPEADDSDVDVDVIAVIASGAFGALDTDDIHAMGESDNG